jgi:hypothetical protein
VEKDDRLDPYERVRSVGGPNLPGVPPPDSPRLISALQRRGVDIRDKPRWRLPVDEAIQGMVDGRWTFFIQGVYDAVDLQVARSPSGVLFLRTEADHDTPDELLFLPPCR